MFLVIKLMKKNTTLNNTCSSDTQLSFIKYKYLMLCIINQWMLKLPIFTG